MSLQRLSFAFVVLATLTALVHCEDIILGDRQPGDSLVETTIFSEPARGEESFSGKASYAPKDGKKITAVELNDRNGDKDGAYAKTLGGGSGESFIDVGFYSNPGYGIDYEVKVYAI